MIHRLRATAVVAVAWLAVAACSASAAPASPRVELTVLAAASLGDALEAAREAYTDDHPETALTLSTDSSAALATRILEGAPADVFLSADESNPARLVEAGLVDGRPVPFAANELTIIVPEGSEVVGTPADLGRPGVKVIAAGEDVPITGYATQVVERLAALGDDGSGYAADYAANVVSREDNVKAVVAKIELGEGDAAIVYVTDVAASDAVGRVDIPPAAQVRTTYAGVVLEGSARLDDARSFLTWLGGAEGLGILDDFGFLPPAA